MNNPLDTNEYNAYYKRYIDRVEESNLITALEDAKITFVTFINNLPEQKMNFAYETGKWTLSEVLQHLIDTERIFCYRALCFARNDKTSFPGFEQDDYIPFSDANSRSRIELLEDFMAVRNSSITLFNSFSTEMLARIGEASGSPMSARAAGYIIVGHQHHHLGIINERYL